MKKRKLYSKLYIPILGALYLILYSFLSFLVLLLINRRPQFHW